MHSANLVHTKWFLIVPFLLLTSNGSFSVSGSPEQVWETHMELLDRIPLFVENQEYPVSVYKINPQILALLIEPARESSFPSLSFEIMEPGRMKVNKLTKFLMMNNPDINYYRARLLASYYYEEARAEGVNQDIAFSQMCLETGFLTFTGVVSPSQNNFCGLGAINSRNQGEIFPTKRHGVRAHIQHLKAYASSQELENSLIDTRFYYVQRETATTVDSLTGRWAIDPAYGEKIKNLMRRLYASGGMTAVTNF